MFNPFIVSLNLRWLVTYWIFFRYSYVQKLWMWLRGLIHLKYMAEKKFLLLVKWEILSLATNWNILTSSELLIMNALSQEVRGKCLQNRVRNWEFRTVWCSGSMSALGSLSAFDAGPLKYKLLISLYFNECDSYNDELNNFLCMS